MLTIWRFLVPKFVDIKPGLLELFKNVPEARFLKQCSYTVKARTERTK